MKLKEIENSVLLNELARRLNANIDKPEQHTITAGAGYEATCAKCGQKTLVSFKPDPSRPVYCRTCYAESLKVRRL